MPSMPITGLILAGGRSKRLHEKDKGLMPFKHRPLIEHVIERLQPQVDELIISANRHIDQYQRYGFQVIEDQLAGFHGPLAGMSAGLQAAQYDCMLTVPCDGPFLPLHLGKRLLSGMQHSSAAYCYDAQREHFTYSILHTSLSGSLRQSIMNHQLKLGKWLAEVNAERVDFSDCPEAFANLNTPEDFHLIEPHQ